MLRAACWPGDHSAHALSQRTPVRPTEGPAPPRVARGFLESVPGPGRNGRRWKPLPGMHRPTAMSTASRTRDVRVWSAIAYPTTFLVQQSGTAAR